MTNSTKFSLLRLPFIAMEKTMQLMEINDQYKLAAASKKAEKLVALSLSREAFSVMVRVEKRFIILIRNSKTRECFEIQLENLGPEEYVNMELLRSHVKSIKNVFQHETTRLFFRNGRPPGFEARILSVFEEYLVISLLKVFSVFDRKPNDELQSWILNKCCNYNHLDIEMETTDNFKLPVSECPKFSCDYLSLEDARWVTGDHLVNFMNVKDLALGYTRFNSEDVSRFINSWISGSRIETADLHRYEGFKFPEEFIGIDAIEIRQAYLTPTSVSRFKKGEAFVVKQASGKEAIVYVYRRMIYLRTDFSRVLQKSKTMRRT